MQNSLAVQLWLCAIGSMGVTDVCTLHTYVFVTHWFMPPTESYDGSNLMSHVSIIIYEYLQMNFLFFACGKFMIHITNHWVEAFALDFQIEWVKTRIKMSLEEWLTNWLTEMRAELFLLIPSLFLTILEF